MRKTGKKIVISDIHGNLDLYQALLHKIDYKPGVDCLILLGDLIEKGKRNLDTLHYIMHQVQTEDVHCIMAIVISLPKMFFIPIVWIF